MKILFINDFKGVDYLNDTTFHGARSLFGSDVVEYKDAWYMYDDIERQTRLSLYGHGFTITGKLPRIEIDRTNIKQKIQDKYFDLIVYGSVHRNLSYWSIVKKHYKKNQIVLIDGEDELDIRHDIVNRGTYFKRELLEETSKLLPISFSIPKEHIVETTGVRLGIDKFHFLARLTNGATGYGFTSEQEYFNEYQNSFFSLTKKKAGWDCMRHYEIAANGCLPVFYKLDELPKGTMTHWNRNLLRDIHEEFWTWRLEANYAVLRESLLQHMHNDLTTESMFKYILSKL